MKLYHATPIENKGSIEEFGIASGVTDKLTSSDDQITDKGVFGFVNMVEAREFGVDCCGGEYVIFSFECKDTVLDPEYDGEAIFWTEAINVEYCESN